MKDQAFGKSNASSVEKTEPSVEYEMSLRRIGRNINDLWLYLRDKLNSSQMKFFNELRYNLLTDIKIINDRDKEWQRKRLNAFNELILSRVERLQNPVDCKTARKLICDPKVYCNFGGAASHWTICLITSLALNRTMVWERTDLNIQKFFKPLSQTCLDLSGKNKTSWGQSSDQNSYQVLKMPWIPNMFPRGIIINDTIDQLPPRIPVQLKSQLEILSDEPYILFTGSLLPYLLRTNNEFKDFLVKYRSDVQFKHPIVGIHVRRTDKLIKEAKYHSLDEYMIYAEDFYNKIDFINRRNGSDIKTKRLIYLATDEITVWKEEVLPWLEKGYQFIGNPDHTKTAAVQWELREREDSIRGLLSDVFMLSECDFIVCGMSSTFCRTAIRLMHTRDPSLPYQTVDNPYFYCFQPYHNLRAILNNKGEDDQELSFNAGDVISLDKWDLTIEGYYQKGYRYGKLRGTNKMIKFPNFKVEEYVETYESLSFD